MTRGLLLALLASFTFYGCTRPVDPDNNFEPGDTDFLNAEPGYDYESNYGRGETDNQAAGAPSAEGDANKAPSGRTRPVEEADIYKIDNNRLFYLNTYRGFLIYDVNDPKAPKQLGRLPVFGHPIEMFVSGTTVYALLKDALYLSQEAGTLKFKRHNVSQLVTIDISDLAHPKVLKTIDIVGQLREGVSRKIENTIYVVSYMPQSYYWPGYPYSNNKTEQAWVYSFNIADAKNPVLVEQLKIFEGGGYNSQTQNTYSGRWFQSVAISATSNTLHVVENWNVYGSVYGSQYNCGSYASLDQAVVSIIDISDPSGKIRVHSHFETYGHLTDQFKHTYTYDAQTGKGTYLGIFARREWSSSNCRGSSLIRNTLESWDITDGANPKKINAINFGKENEDVRGSAFDDSRKVVYAITARQIDPLYAISYADPANLKILSAVDGLSGDMNLFRLINGGKFLIGIGRDNTTTCTGFTDPSQNRFSTNMAVSVIDVQDLSKVRLVQRQCVAVQNAEWSSVWSQINWNLDQAHKMIGMHSDAQANVISVPVSYYKKRDANDSWWWYGWESAVGIMTWDLNNYDANNPALATNVLKNYGTVVHENGQVRRSILFTHTGVQKRMMINLSDTHVSVVDVANLAAPSTQSTIEVAPYHARLMRFGDYLVDQVTVGGYWNWNQGGSEFRIKPASGTLEDAPPVASFTVGQVERVLKWKNNLLLFRRLPYNGRGYYQNQVAEMLIYDLSDPTRPVRKTSILVPADLPYYWYWCGDGLWWGGYSFYGDGNRFISTERGITFLAHSYDQYGSTQKLVAIDLTDNSSPKLSEQILQVYNYQTQGTQQRAHYGLFADPVDANNFYLTYRDLVSSVPLANNQKMYYYRYYAQSYSHDDQGFHAGSAINVPGRLTRAYARGGERIFLTSDNRYQWTVLPNNINGQWVAQPRLLLLKQVSVGGVDKAALLDKREFTDFQLRDVVGDGSRLFVNLQRGYQYLSLNKLNYNEVSDQLTIFDLSGDKLDEKYNSETGTYGTQIMGLRGNRLFLNLASDGILMVNVTDLAKPVGMNFVRTLGYTSGLEFSNSSAYAPAGYFGIYQLDLNNGSLVAGL